MKKYLTIIITIFVLLLLVVSFALKSNNNQMKKNKIKVVEDVIQNVYYNDKVTRKELEQNVKNPMISEDIFTGPNSALRVKPNSEIIKKYHLEKYEKIIDSYYPLVEKKHQDNTKYTMKEVDGVIEVTVVSWNYSQYSGDLSLITMKLMERDGYSMKTADLSSTEFKVYEYKARAIATKILNDHLDDYDNKTNEEHKVKIEFNGNQAGKNEYYTLYMVLAGVTSSNSQMNNPNYAQDNDERLEGYITEAINNHLINSEHPLEVS